MQSFLKDSRRSFTLSADDIARLNPNTHTCPIFRSQKDAEITKGIYQRVPVLWEEGKVDGNPWGITFRQGLFNMSSDSVKFREVSQLGELLNPVALYEAKMIDFYDHRAGSYHLRSGERGHRVLPNAALTDYENPNYSVTPFYWVEKSEIDEILASRWQAKWMLAFKDVTAATNERTVIASIIPRVGVGHTAPLIFPSKCNVAGYESTTISSCLLLANLLSLTLDYVARLKVGGLHLTYTYLRQLPVLPPSMYSPIEVAAIIPRVLELTFTANDIKPFYDDVVAENLAWDQREEAERGLPWLWNLERRAVLRG